MTDLSRSLLAAAREGLAPDAEVAARIRARVGAAVGAPVGVAAAKSATAGSSSIFIKLGALAIVAGVVTFGIARHKSSGDAPQLSLSAERDELAQPAVTSTAREPATHVGAAPTSAAPLSGAPTSAVGSAPTSAKAPASLSREVELIDDAMTALRKHDPSTALASMRTFDRETLGRAQMAEEAAAITIEAHCGLGDDISARIVAFDQAWPTSAERARITAACAPR